VPRHAGTKLVKSEKRGQYEVFVSKTYRLRTQVTYHTKLAGGSMVRLLSKHDVGGVKVDVNAITYVGCEKFGFVVVARTWRCGAAIWRTLLIS